jgi:hypothetical protein
VFSSAERYSEKDREHTWRRSPKERLHASKGGEMTSELTPESMDLLCKLLKDAIQVHPEARPVVMSLVDTLMDHHVRQEQWGSILFCVWQELQEESGSGAYNDGSGR